jgi:hypothetical protein
VEPFVPLHFACSKGRCPPQGTQAHFTNAYRSVSVDFSRFFSKKSADLNFFNNNAPKLWITGLFFQAAVFSLE